MSLANRSTRIRGGITKAEKEVGAADIAPLLTVVLIFCYFSAQIPIGRQRCPKVANQASAGAADRRAR
jgi:hypothetical protein